MNIHRMWRVEFCLEINSKRCMICVCMKNYQQNSDLQSGHKWILSHLAMHVECCTITIQSSATEMWLEIETPINVERKKSSLFKTRVADVFHETFKLCYDTHAHYTHLADDDVVVNVTSHWIWVLLS